MTPADYAALGIDPQTILYVFSWGFGSVLFSWSLGFGLGCAVRAIRMM